MNEQEFLKQATSEIYSIKKGNIYFVNCMTTLR